MSASAPSPPLEYAPQPVWFRRRWKRLTLLGLLALLIIAALLWRKDIQWAVERGRLLYTQHRCLALQPPDGTVVYEEDPARAQALLAHEDYRPAVGPDGNPAAALWWPQAVSGWPEARKYVWPNPPPAILFMHEVKSTAGKRVLLIATTAYEATHPERVVLRVDAVTPATWRKASESRTGLATFMDKPPLDRDAHARPDKVPPLRIYAGRLDPNDPSRVLIEYEGGGDHGFAELHLVDGSDGSGPELKLGWRRIIRENPAQ